MLVALWHSIVNVGIVIAAFVLAMICFHYRHPARDSVLILLLGIGVFLVEVYFGVLRGRCDPAEPESLVALAQELDACSNPYGWNSVVGQVFILGALLAWLGLAWRAVVRKLVGDEENGA